MPDVVAKKGLTHFLHQHVSNVWIRFLLAIAGLVLAFAAALFSTVSRESGDMWATFILASAALLLAAIVGLPTVPYLARRVAVARVRQAIDYDVTRVGIIYILTAIVIGIAALNTGNNLLYIVVASILVSSYASALVLRELELDVRLPELVFAGRQVFGRIIVRNRRRWLPSFSISVIPPKKRKAAKVWRWEHTTFAFPSTRRLWFSLPDRSLRRFDPGPVLPGIFEGSVYFPYIAPQSNQSADLTLRFDRRGRYQQDSFGLSTRFPFSFLTKSRPVPLGREVMVYPSVEPTDEFFEVLPLITGEFETFVRGRGYDLYRIREYMPEDSARHVDWKATAKSGSPKVREFTREDERRVRIVFDNPNPRAVTAETYERAVTLAASLAWHFTSQHAETSFAAQGYSGPADLYQFLAYLAVIEPKPGKSVIDDLRVSDDYNIVLTTRPRGTMPTRLWSCSYFVFVEDRR